MFKRLAIGIILNGLALYGVVYFFPLIKYSGGWMFFVVGGLVMGVLNWIIKPIIKIFTFPLQILTMGLSLIAVNAVIFWLFDQVIQTTAIKGVSLTVPDIKSYFIAGVIFGIINWLEHLIIPNK